MDVEEEPINNDNIVDNQEQATESNSTENVQSFRIEPVNITIEYDLNFSERNANNNENQGNNEASTSEEQISIPQNFPTMNVLVRLSRNAVAEAAASNFENNSNSVNVGQNDNDEEVRNLENNFVQPEPEREANNEEVIIVEDVQNNDVEIINEIQLPNNRIESPCTPSSIKKRKRSKSKTPVKSTINYDDENDDGTICPICLDEWEMSGPHRLTSLKCGHLFGHSCIKRWLQECVPGTKCCPSCKTRAQPRDLRFIYAKRVCAVDKSEEYRLKELLSSEKSKFAQLNADYGLLKLELAMTKTQLTKLEGEVEILKRGSIYGSTSYSRSETRNYRLFMEKNVEISKEAGCRVMLYGQQSQNLFVSQKSNQNLFPGYGVRFIDIENFRPLNFLHMSSKPIRDLSLSSSEDLLLSATQERSAKLFNVHDRTTVSVFTPSEKAIWSCALDQDLNKYVYLGSQSGTTYIYDIRQSSTILDEIPVEDDRSSVINICAVPNSDIFPHGGILICKLQSVWFCEFTSSQDVNIRTKMNIEGPFISMSYDITSCNVLISTRPSTKYSTSRYILGKLIKLNDITVLETQITFTGSKYSVVMSRCSQLIMNDTTLIAAYLQDVKLLSIWDSKRNSRIQCLPIADTVYDTCPIVNCNQIYLAALTECKCRIYKLISSEKT